MTQLPLSLAVAADARSRARGLGGRTHFAPGEDGMLFAFEAPTRGSFWNANTLLPLDLVFIDEHARVTEVIPMRTIVETRGVEESYAPRQPYVIALELPRGFVTAAGMPIGAHASVYQKADRARALVVLEWRGPMKRARYAG